MDGFLKQNTSYTLKIGMFVDDTDGVTAEVGLAIAQADVRLSKNGGAFAQKNDATACTHDENGWYGCPVNATDTGTLGLLKLSVSKAGAVPVWHNYCVVTANVYDTLCSTDYLDVNLVADQSAASIALTAAAVDTILDDACDSTITVRQALKIILAAVAGKTTVAGAVVNFRDVADTKNRIAATVATSTKTRTAVTLDGA